MLYERLGLNQTVRVAADGTVTRGIEVPHLAANLPRSGDGGRMLATPPRHVGGLRFAPGAIPRGVDQHLPCTVKGCERCGDIDRAIREGANTDVFIEAERGLL